MAITVENFAISCDWQINGTVEHLEGRLHDFHFQGEGWYNDGTGQYMLVLLIPEPTAKLDPHWKKGGPPIYSGYIYGCDPRETFKKAAELPEFK